MALISPPESSALKAMYRALALIVADLYDVFPRGVASYDTLTREGDIPVAERESGRTGSPPTFDDDHNSVAECLRRLAANDLVDCTDAGTYTFTGVALTASGFARCERQTVIDPDNTLGRLLSELAEDSATDPAPYARSFFA